MSFSIGKYSVILLSSDDTVIPYINDGFNLEHCQEYKIAIYNHDNVKRIDAEIEIDGKLIGKFRVEPSNNIIIERPSSRDKCRKLTFYAVDSLEGEMSELKSIPRDRIGSLIVSINVEKCNPLQLKSIYKSNSTSDRCRSGKCKIGATGLGEVPNQTFQTYSDIDYDRDKLILIAMMRLKQTRKIIPL